MAHFAQIESTDNPRLFTVKQVLVVEPDFVATGALGDPRFWIQTSYNTRGNVHYNGDGTPSSSNPLRGNFAGIGHTYDQTNDVFYAPQPYPSWTLNTDRWLWEPPVAYPTDGAVYQWSEDELAWVAITA